MYQTISDEVEIRNNNEQTADQTQFLQQTSILKYKLIEHETMLQTLREQLNHVDQHLLVANEATNSSSTNQSIKRRHTFNSSIDFNSPLFDQQRNLFVPFSSSSSLFALQLL